MPHAAGMSPAAESLGPHREDPAKLRVKEALSGFTMMLDVVITGLRNLPPGDGSYRPYQEFLHELKAIGATVTELRDDEALPHNVHRELANISNALPPAVERYEQYADNEAFPRNQIVLLLMDLGSVAHACNRVMRWAREG